jgi:hypothetical protein
VQASRRWLCHTSPRSCRVRLPAPSWPRDDVMPHSRRAEPALSHPRWRREARRLRARAHALRLQAFKDPAPDAEPASTCDGAALASFQNREMVLITCSCAHHVQMNAPCFSPRSAVTRFLWIPFISFACLGMIAIFGRLDGFGLPVNDTQQ